MQRIEASDFEDIDQVTQPRVSPDGTQIAFVKKSPDGDEEYTATIYIADVEGGEPQRFTLEEGTDSDPRWSPSGDRLAFSSTRGSDNDHPQLWVLPTDGGEARQVTNVVGGVAEPTWGPDGDRVAFVQRVTDEDCEEDRDTDLPEEFEPDQPDPRVIDRTVYRTGEQYLDGKQAHVYLVDVDSEAVERLTSADRDHTSPVWSGAETLYFATDGDVPDPDDSLESDIVEYDLETGEMETVHTTTAFEQSLAATSDGRVAFLYTDPDRGTLGQTELKLLGAETGDVTPLTDDLDRTLSYGARPHWGPAERSLYFSTPDEGATALWEIEAETLADVTDPERLVRDDWCSISGAHVGESVAFVQSGWDHPGDLFAVSDGERKRLTECNADLLAEKSVVEPEEIRYAAGEAGEQASDTELQGWVLTPPAFDPEEEYPVIVEVHGGPHAMWTTSGTMWHEFQTLAARGYVVFWSNPRGSAGYGDEFMRAIEHDWGEVTMSDVMAGVEKVTARDYVDEAQLFLTGGSFGGYMTSWMVGQTDEFSAAVSQRGVYDLTGFWGSTDWAYKLVEDEFGTTPWEDPSFLAEHSPTGHAHKAETPTLLIHSDDDYRTPVSTAELFHRILRKHGVDTRFVRYPNDGHELSRSGQPGHIIDRIERIARWFDGYSESHDAARALDRDPDAGLTAGETDSDEKTDETN